MGTTTRPIPFFVDTIYIVVSECSNPRNINHTMSIREFSNGAPVRLEVVEETGEYICTKQNGEFISGHERD